MKNKKSLRYQFKRQLAFSIGFLVLVFSVVLYQVFVVGKQTTMLKTMQSLAHHYVCQIEHDAQYPLPKRGAYSVFVGRSDVPPHISELFHFSRLADMQLYSHDKGNSLFSSQQRNNHFLFVHPIKHSTKKLYLVYNERPPRIEPTQNKHANKIEYFISSITSKNLMWNVPISIIALVLIAIGLVYFVAHSLIKKVLNPLAELSAMADSVNVKSIDTGFQSSTSNNSYPVLDNGSEIGEVAKTLQKSVQSIQQYHQREKQFLQSASHELRTPIAVISSALDIIKLRTSNNNHDVEDQHTNILRANKNMAELTHALLLLSRKNGEHLDEQPLDLALLAKEIISEHEYLLENKNIDVLVNTSIQSQKNEGGNLPILPHAFCSIILSNLIRNAFEHTIEGKVIIEINSHQINVINTNATHPNYAGKSSLNEDEKPAISHGFGLGLEIVKQIVSQLKWRMELTNSKSYTVVSIYLDDDRNKNS